MDDLAIHAVGLGKRYRVGQLQPYLALRDSIAEGAAATARGVGRLLRPGRDPGDARSRRAKDFIWAIRDVSFDVREGEAVGIIGRNGAGKSTLLKVLSRITEPTEGRADLRGRVSSLLEVGTGFHPELTGRENIFLNGAILGMGRREIRRKLDEIIAFAEVERFIDTPVKRYSSGMHMRLAFAVAAHLEPEILIVDEVLAVGDAVFQRKCLGKMSAAAGEGRTVLFVSHNMVAIESLCERVFWMDAGRIVDEGTAAKMVSRYMSTAFSAHTDREWPDIESAPGNDRVRMRRARVRLEDPSEGLTVRTPFAMEFEYWNLRPGAHIHLSLHVYNEQGMLVFVALPGATSEWRGHPFPAGLFRDVCHVPGDLLNDGAYRVLLWVVENDMKQIFVMEDALAFEVADAGSEEARGAWHGKWPGAVRPMLDWQTELVTADDPAVTSDGSRAGG